MLNLLTLPPLARAMRAALLLLLLLILGPSASAQEWSVWPGVVEEAATGTRTETGSKNALAHAIHESAAGDVIEVHGNLPRVNLALGENYRANDVVRAEPIDVTIRGVRGAKVHGFSISDKAGGVARLRVESLTIDARGSQVGVIGHMDAVLGTLEFVDVELLSNSKTKWGFRIHGWSEELTFIRVSGREGGQEHLIYVDSPRTNVTCREIIGSHWLRTLIQVVLREKPGSPGITRPAARGDLTIEDCEAYDCGKHGAFNYTVTGWPLGNVYFRNNHGESKYETGLFVCYLDPKQGTLLTPEGFAVEHLVWAHNVGIYPNGVREGNGIGSVAHLEVKVGHINEALQLTGNTAFDLMKNGKANGTEGLYSRGHPWDYWNIQAPKKFRKGKTFLDREAVGALWVPPEDA